MIAMQVDMRGLTERLTTLQETQLPFATSLALNNVAKDFQAAERAHLRDIFTVRHEQWVDRSIKITHFATKAEPWATVAVQPPGSDGAAKADILGKFEDETEKTPTNGHLALAVPVEVKRTRTDVVSPSLRPARLNFQRVSSRGSGMLYVGAHNTLMIQRPDGSGIILQRSAHHVRGAQDGTVLYVLRPRVRITPDLHFQQLAEQTVAARFAARFEEALSRAMATAR